MRIRWLVLFFLFGGVCWNIAAQVEVYPQLGHTSDVNSVAFSPDGKQIISSSNDGNIKLWDAAAGREIRTISQHTGSALSVAFSLDGRQIIIGSDNSIKMLDVATGRETKTFSGHTGNVWSVTFSPDGKQILSGSLDNTIKLWDAATGREIRTFSGHTEHVNSVAFSLDGKQIVSGSSDETVKLWDAATGREIRTFSGHTSYVYPVAFSPDGKQIVSGSWDKTVKLWDAATGREIRTLSGHTSDVNSIAFSPDGKQIVSGSRDRTIKFWDVATGREIRTLNTSAVRSIIYSPDSKQLLSGGGNVKLWDAATGREIRTFSGYTNNVSFVGFSHDGRQILSSSRYGKVSLWDMATGREIRILSSNKGLGNVYSVTFSPDGWKMLSVDSTFGEATIWDCATGREMRTIELNPTLEISGIVYSVAFSPDGKQIISGLYKNIKLWDVATGREIRTLSGHTGDVNSVAFSSDGRQIISSGGYNDNTVKLWDATTGREIRTFSGHTRDVYSVAFSPDGRQIISGSRDGTVKLWDAVTGREIRTLSGHTSDVKSVAFSPNGRQIISGSNDRTVTLWDAATGKEIRTISGYSSYVNFVAFSPDGRQILSGSRDGTAHLWDIATGREIAQFISFNDGEWIALTPDGYYNASPNGDRSLNVRFGNNVYGIDQYRATFYRPQIVEARLQGKPDPVQVATTIQDAASYVPPVVVIRSPENGTNITTGQAELSVSVVDQNQPIKSIQVYINGRLVGGEALRGITGLRGGDHELRPTEIQLKENQKRVEFKLQLSLDPGTNRIEVKANNPYSEGRDSVEVSNRQTASGQNILPNLWILSIGINRYNDNELRNLDYAVNDAREIINAFKAQEGKVYRKVNSLLIADGAAVTPTYDHIIDNFSFLMQAGQRDVVLLFIAGHGKNDDGGNFYFLPSDTAFNTDGSIRPSRAISWRQIQSVLDVPGQKLVFIDSCHSEGSSGRKTRSVDNNQLVRVLQDNGTVIFTSSRGSQLSQESKEFGHGIFTYAIIQGMKGAADLVKDGSITMKELDAYVSETVPKLTNGLQHPTTNTPDGYVNFVVANSK
jgi:WD40 repeat protein